jgi:ATP-binding cassette, subfamily B, bacterial PglK
MLNALRKIFAMLPLAEKRNAFKQLVVIVISVFLNLVSITGILPFLYNVANPGYFRKSPILMSVYETFGFHSDRAFLMALGFLSLFALIVSNAFALFHIWYLTRFEGSVMVSLASRLFEIYIHKPYSYFLENEISGITCSVIDETAKVVQKVIASFLRLVGSIAYIFLIVLMLFIFDPRIAFWLTLAFGTSYLLTFVLVRQKLTSLGSVIDDLTSRRSQIVTEPLRSIKEIKVMARESYFTEKFNEVSEGIIRRNSTFTFISFIPQYLIEAIAFGSMVALTLYVMGTQSGETQLIPLIGLYAFAAHRLLPEFRIVFGLLSSVRYHLNTLNRVNATITEAGLADARELVTNLLTFKKSVELRNVHFSYPNSNRDILKDLSFTIPVNTAVALVGKTGAGKSTIVNLITGLLSPNEGAILIDGISLDEANVRGWQRNIGYVSQDPYVFNETVAQNIAVGVKEFDFEKVIHAAKIARAYDFIMNDLPHGFDTKVGEGGIRLSGGQRQRIAIARALFHDPQVLVFDEATNALDVLTEQSFYQAIADLVGKKTLIVVTHRIKTAEMCDQILFVGKKVDSGTFKDLQIKIPEFREMVLSTSS